MLQIVMKIAIRFGHVKVLVTDEICVSQRRPVWNGLGRAGIESVV